MMLRLVDRLVAIDLIGPFVNGFFMFLVLVFAAAYLPQATDLIVKGASTGAVLKLIVFKLPSVTAQTFPMAMLLAGLLSFGRISADREAVALFAAGCSFPRMIRGVILAGVVVSVVAFFWNDIVVPPASTAFWNLQQQVVSHYFKSTQPLAFSFDYPDGAGVEEYVTVARGWDPKTKTIRGVTILKYADARGRHGEPQVIVYCDRAVARDALGLDWTYYNGYAVAPWRDPKTGLWRYPEFGRFAQTKTLADNAAIRKPFGEIPGAGTDDPDRLTFAQLRARAAEDTRSGELSKARGEEVNLYGKIALPIASLIFGVVGAALGLNTTRGGGRTVGFGLAIFIVFIYWAFYHAMFVIGNGGRLPPMLASFLADIIGAVVGAILTLRASR
ncbi:MAG: LptF/LptG family permease [Armatimonadetes bacterium]|nr:LptF/LptG family permease [Armatimonadota bacterium]MDE2205290.1 LptF/LptG family permease [Armatimonadota bacterium]